MERSDRALRLASVLYCDQLELRLQRTGVLVLCVIVAAYALLRSTEVVIPAQKLLLLMLPIALCSLSVLRLRALRVSVTNDSFGYTRSEAKALINFIIRNADRIQDEDGGIGMRPKARATSTPAAGGGKLPWDAHAEPAPSQDV